jgi:hypothetical protein
MGEDTTITVRGVDLDVWKEFQKSIIDKYGNLYGYLGPEVTNALKSYLGTSKPETRRTDYSSYAAKPDIPRVLDSAGTKSVRDLILEAFHSLGEEATIQEVTSFIHQKYGNVNPNTISTSMSDLSINGPPSSLYREDQKFLERVSRGRYRLLKAEGEDA